MKTIIVTLGLMLSGLLIAGFSATSAFSATDEHWAGRPTHPCMLNQCTYGPGAAEKSAGTDVTTPEQKAIENSRRAPASVSPEDTHWRKNDRLEFLDLRF